jgi:hypothetical protein
MLFALKHLRVIFFTAINSKTLCIDVYSLRDSSAAVTCPSCVATEHRNRIDTIQKCSSKIKY